MAVRFGVIFIIDNYTIDRRINYGEFELMGIFYEVLLEFSENTKSQWHGLF